MRYYRFFYKFRIEIFEYYKLDLWKFLQSREYYLDKVYIYIYIIGKIQWRGEGTVRGRLSLGKFGERLRVGIMSGYGRWCSKWILMKAAEGGEARVQRAERK